MPGGNVKSSVAELGSTQWLRIESQFRPRGRKLLIMFPPQFGLRDIGPLNQNTK